MSELTGEARAPASAGIPDVDDDRVGASYFRSGPAAAVGSGSPGRVSAGRSDPNARSNPFRPWLVPALVGGYFGATVSGEIWMLAAPLIVLFAAMTWWAL